MTDIPGNETTVQGASALASMTLPPSRLVIGPVSISLDDGSIKYGDGYEPDEAARTFWEAMSKTYGTSVAAVERVRALHQCCECRREFDISLTPIVHCDGCNETWPCPTIQALEQP